ncbi:MAG: coenzyme F420-0:L-glutamate ligase [Anaerolineaceae bacterium]|jgi:coenzyme F420-0:L-glutamate ligase/coenzyme F420-1:gamma-L-glutamate ligase|nr:MAG: coenzyme F420-0:L-glutamate ligase [Anaerolineaceae bacterium]
MKRQPLIFTPLDTFPLINPGQDLPEIIYQALQRKQLTLKDGDILVITQKIVSKAEGRLANLSTIAPSKKALEVAEITKKDARLVELILSESKEIIRMRENTLIVEHKLGFICANAGIDHSNVKGDWGKNDDWYLLLPEDPSRSARKIRDFIHQQCGRNIGVMIVDSHGRAWRKGTVGVSIGFSGIPGIVDMRGKEDLFGYHLKITQIAAADELAASASLVMGQADEMIPIVHVRGFPYPLCETSFHDILRKKDEDLFR